MYEQRCRLGQCFKYGDKFMLGYKYSVKGLHMIAGNEEDDFLDVEAKNIIEERMTNKKIKEYSLSLNTLADNYAHNTIRIRGSYHGKELVILIDNGSTHNFIDEHIARELQISVERSLILAVTIANSSTILYDSYTMGFKWFMQNYEFVVDLKILKLGRCDVVLGMDWLNSPVLFDFIKIKISFRKEGRMIELRGIVEGANLQCITVEKVQKNLRAVITGFVGQYFFYRSKSRTTPCTY